VRGIAVLALGVPEENRWDYVALVRYPSRGAFIAMMTSPEYARANIERFRSAGSTIENCTATGMRRRGGRAWVSIQCRLRWRCGDDRAMRSPRKETARFRHPLQQGRNGRRTTPSIRGKDRRMVSRSRGLIATGVPRSDVAQTARGQSTQFAEEHWAADRNRQAALPPQCAPTRAMRGNCHRDSRGR